jgi:hypothetical protein
MDTGTKRIRRECMVYGNPNSVHQTFLTHVWWHGGFPALITMCLKTYELEPAKDEAGSGAIRQVPSYLQEEVVAAEMGKFVEYRIKRKAWLPLSYHRGRVSFEAAEGDQTKVVWEISYTPWMCFSGFLFGMLAVMIGWFFLPQLSKHCKKPQPQSA